MKKLMIALAAVAMGFAANAAAVDWTASNIYAGNSTTKVNAYTVYMFAESTLSRSSAVAFLEASDTTFLKVGSSGALGSAKTTATGKFSASGIGTVENGSAMTGYMVIVDDSDSPTVAYITKVLEGSASTSAGGAAVQAFGKLDGTSSYGPDSKLSTSWYNVPEPCSGLLMLVGMGALALRRRRA